MLHLLDAHVLGDLVQHIPIIRLFGDVKVYRNKTSGHKGYGKPEYEKPSQQHDSEYPQKQFHNTFSHINIVC